MDAAIIWSSVLTAAISLITWTIKSKSDEIQRISILLNRTREEMAKEYVTKADVHADINRVIDRIEALDSKLDRLMERSSAWDHPGPGRPRSRLLGLLLWEGAREGVP